MKPYDTLPDWMVENDPDVSSSLQKTDMKLFCDYIGERSVQRAAVCLYTYKTRAPEQQMSKNYITFTWQSSKVHCRQTSDGHQWDLVYSP